MNANLAKYILVTSAVIFGLYLFLNAVSAHPVNWVELNEETFSNSINWNGKYSEEMNPALFPILNKIKWASPWIGRLFITSGPRSQHHGGNAVDFTWEGSWLLSECQKLKVQSQLRNNIMYALQELSLEDKVGLGIYLKGSWKKTPIFHIDIRGTKARWVRLPDGSDTGMVAGLKKMKELEEAECLRYF